MREIKLGLDRFTITFGIDESPHSMLNLYSCCCCPLSFLCDDAAVKLLKKDVDIWFNIIYNI